MVGQPQARRMNFGLIGQLLGHSFSKAYFEERWRQEGLNHTYTNFEIPRIQEVDSVLDRVDVHGLNVTIPYKESILPYLAAIDPTAQAIGAVNCLKPTSAGWVGYNTDWLGFTQSLIQAEGHRAPQAIILGTGGASKAIAYGLEQLKIPFKVVSRHPEGSQITYADLAQPWLPGSLLINCTPLGTWPDVHRMPPMPLNQLNSSHVVFDLVYNPPVTALLQASLERGARIISGGDMLRIQAEEAWKIWTM
jgi:shikimate dehydrogenase